MLANIGSVGLLSGGIGAAMGMGPGGITKAFQMFHGNRFSKGLGDKVAQFSDDLTAAMTSGDRATIAKFRDPEFLDRFIEFDKIRKGTQDDTEAFVNSFLDDMAAASELTTGRVKKAEMDALAKVADPQITLHSMADTLAAARKKIVEIDDPSTKKLLEAVDSQIEKMGSAIELQLKSAGHMPPKAKIVFDVDDSSFKLDFSGRDTGFKGKKPLSFISESETAAVDAAKREASLGRAKGETAKWEKSRGATLRSEDERLTREIEDRQRQVDTGRIAEERFDEATGRWTSRSKRQAQEELDEMLSQRTAVRSEIDSATSSMRAAEAATPEPTVPIVTDYGDLVGDLFNQLDDFKKIVGSYAYKRRPETAVGFGLDREMNNLYQLMRNALEDEALFGKAALAQKAVNAPFHELLKIAPDFNKKFTVKVAGERQANSNRIKSFIRRSDDFDDGAKIDKEVFEETTRRFTEFASAAKAHYTGGADKGFDRLLRNTEAINKKWADFGELLAAQKELRHLSQTNDSSMSLLAGGAAYAIGGIPGAVIAAAANDIIRPGNAIRRRMVVHNMKSMMTKRIDKSVSRVTDRIMKNKAGGPQRASKVPSILALVGVSATGDSNKDVAAEMQAIHQISSPDALTARIEKGTADLEDAPMIREELTNATIRQMSMLQEAAARAGIVESDPLTGQQKITMSDAGKAEYLQVRDTLADPIGVTTQALEDGTASRTMGRTFAQAFPVLFQEFTDKLLGDIREEAEKTGNSISYADNLQLSSFTGIPLSPTLNPGFIGAMQNVMKATEQGRRPQRRVASLKESANRAILPGDRALT